jgi:hypothetical protein
VSQPPTPPQRTLPSLAARKRLAAERHELKAIRLRADAAELDRRWREFKLQHNTVTASAAQRDAAQDCAS